VAVAVRAERHRRVVHVQAADALEPDDLDAPVDHPGELRVVGDVEAAREHVAAVEADPDALVPAGHLDEPGELLERTPERAARAGRVLEQQRAALGLGERVAEGLADAVHRLLVRLLHLRAGMDDDPVGADQVAELERVDERGERLAPDVRVLRGAVDQVDRVDRDRADRPARHPRAELLDVRLLPARRPPHPRRLVEDLDRVAAELDAALPRRDEPASRRDVGAD
jgi:hypothetical protein